MNINGKNIEEYDLLDQQLYYGILGEFDKGYEIAMRLQKERPYCNRCKFNLGWYILKQGDLHKGMELLNSGRFENVFGNRHIGCTAPIYDGRQLVSPNNYVLFNCEGGFGDQIIGIRFAKEIHNRGAKVIVNCSPELINLFSKLNFISALTCGTTNISNLHFNYWVPSMSAEYILDYSFDTLPNDPYIIPDKNYIEKYNHILFNNKTDKLKVGVRFRGNPQFEHEQHRVFPEQLLFDAVNNPNLEVYSLQKEGNIKLPDHINNLEYYLNTWDDTAAIISNLDLVITSCTSIAHLAAAMGKPTWVIVPVLSYYIWSYELNIDNISCGEFTSYYKTVRLFRQKNYGEWDSPFKDIKNGLNNIISMRNK